MFCHQWEGDKSCSYWAVQWSWFAWVNALCNLSCKKLQEVAVSFPGRFLSCGCFMLCIAIEAEPRIVKQYKCHHHCSCKNYWGKGMEGGKKVSLRCFLADQRIAVSWGNILGGASYTTSNKLLLVARHILTTGLPKSLYSWQCKIHKFAINAFHCEESTH